MMPLCHIYISSQVAGYQNNYLSFGSVLPDIRVNGKSKLIQIHNNPFEFANFVNNNYSALKDLAQGALMHSAESGGADHYCDDNQTGYAKIMGRQIRDDVSKLLRTRDRKYEVIDHNIIEAAMEIEIQTIDSNLIHLLANCYKDLNSNNVIDCLVNYTNKPKCIIANEIEGLTVDAFRPTFFQSADAIAINTVRHGIKLRYKIDVEPSETVLAVKLAQEIIRDTFPDFLNRTILEMKKTFVC